MFPAELLCSVMKIVPPMFGQMICLQFLTFRTAPQISQGNCLQILSVTWLAGVFASLRDGAKPFVEATAGTGFTANMGLRRVHSWQTHVCIKALFLETCGILNMHGAAPLFPYAN